MFTYHKNWFFLNYYFSYLSTILLVFDNLLVMSGLLAGFLSEKVVLLPHVVLSRAVTILFVHFDIVGWMYRFYINLGRSNVISMIVSFHKSIYLIFYIKLTFCQQFIVPFKSNNWFIV